MFALFASLPMFTSASNRRRYVCMTPKLAPNCYWTHGQLKFWEGTPSLRLWKIGTERILGIYSGPETYPGDLNGDNEHPELPANVKAKLKPFDNALDAAFEVCPLEPEKPKTMQAACIEAAKHIVVVSFGK
ncbi:MAG TPA: hypothetical protein VMU92_11250 [Acidobacteriaceae bacterium]|nr:hypothetical protein [Acidobacteriaceae bacterium]